MSHVGTRYEFKDKPSDYASLARELTSLLAGETDLIANAANMTALIFDAVPRLNWTGIYFLKNADLVVGPFQGRPQLQALDASGAESTTSRPSDRNPPVKPWGTRPEGPVVVIDTVVIDTDMNLRLPGIAAALDIRARSAWISPTARGQV